MLDALANALKAEGATLRLVAPEVGGVEASDGTWYEADGRLDGGPSVLFNAVAILASEIGTHSWNALGSNEKRAPSGSAVREGARGDHSPR